MVVADFTLTCVAALPPNMTVLTTLLPSTLKNLPVIVTLAPPDAEPTAGLTLVTTGAFAAAKAETGPARPMTSTAMSTSPITPVLSVKPRLTIPASR